MDKAALLFSQQHASLARTIYSQAAAVNSSYAAPVCVRLCKVTRSTYSMLAAYQDPAGCPRLTRSVTVHA